MVQAIIPEKVTGHPCFDAASRLTTGRIHLPVAPECNIKCNYCSRKFDCANESRPGVTSRVVTPEEAVETAREAIALEPRIKVVGIAGPGEPLANEATFETVRLLNEEFPDLSLCLSTNGLLLPEKIDELADAGLKTLTVTINTLNEATGAKIYNHVFHEGEILTGTKAASVLRNNQLKGIRMAVKRGIRVKANSILLPNINEHEMIPLSITLHDMGVSVMNIMTLIPQADFAHLTPVSKILHQKIRQECSLFIDQIYHCRQCRADAAGMLGHDLKLAAACC